jgi:hypothetical protein
VNPHYLIIGALLLLIKCDELSSIDDEGEEEEMGERNGEDEEDLIDNIGGVEEGSVE